MKAQMTMMLAVAWLAFSGPALAGEDALSRSVSEDLTTMSSALEPEWDELSRDETPASEDAERWYLQQFRVRLQGKAGVEVPWLAGLEIVPEVELIFQRKAPEGWTSYKP